MRSHLLAAAVVASLGLVSADAFAAPASSGVSQAQLQQLQAQIAALQAQVQQLQNDSQALQAQSERVQTLLRRRGGTTDYPPGAICPGLSEVQLEPIRQQLRAAVAGAGLDPQKVSVARSAAPSLEAIAPVDVRLETNGAYGPTLLMLDVLSRQTPLLYVDTVDLRSRTDTVNLQLSGRLYCWTAAPR